MSSETIRVLIAEDEALIRLDLKDMLEGEGYSVVAEVGDGQQAVDQARELTPDLVILDIQMPVLDGLSAAEQIASARIAPVIVLTAVSQLELVERAKGRLMEDQGMTEAEAFRWIQRTAMNQRTSMKALAQSILEPAAGQETTAEA